MLMCSVLVKIKLKTLFLEIREDEEEKERTSTTSPTTTSTHRKRRILFTREQTYELQKVFQYQQYLTVPQRDYLSRKINLTPTQVKLHNIVLFFNS